MIFNTHSHINDKLEKINELYQECLEKKVTHVATVGYNYISSANAIKAANMQDGIYAICGLQPQEVTDFDGDFDKFIELFNEEKCIAIGEIGLDYYYGKETQEKQIECFEKQLQIACNFKKPVVIHCRDAHEDTYNLLAKYKDKLDGIILHCYTGSVEMMERYLKIGAYISITGVVTFKNAKTIKEVAKACPLDRLLVETDDPYLTPVAYRGQENKPSYVYYVVQEIASLRETSFEEIENASFENARKVFHL